LQDFYAYLLSYLDVPINIKIGECFVGEYPLFLYLKNISYINDNDGLLKNFLELLEVCPNENDLISFSSCLYNEYYINSRWHNYNGNIGVWHNFLNMENYINSTKINKNIVSLSKYDTKTIIESISWAKNILEINKNLSYVDIEQKEIIDIIMNAPIDLWYMDCTKYLVKEKWLDIVGKMKPCIVLTKNKRYNLDRWQMHEFNNGFIIYDNLQVTQ
jgi:hypothetical protein